MAKKQELEFFMVGDFPYEYAYCPNAKLWKAHFRKLEEDFVPPPFPSCDTGGRCTQIETYDTCIVTIGDRNPPDIVESILVHEAVHVFQNACEHAGEIEPSSEFQAYSIQAIYYNLSTEYKKAAKSSS